MLIQTKAFYRKITIFHRNVEFNPGNLENNDFSITLDSVLLNEKHVRIIVVHE